MLSHRLRAGNRSVCLEISRTHESRVRAISVLAMLASVAATATPEPV